MTPIKIDVVLLRCVYRLLTDAMSEFVILLGLASTSRTEFYENADWMCIDGLSIATSTLGWSA